jgi:ATP-dependent Clp protease ATP-binding subunit ClpB
VILFDEIEKAHHDAFNVLLQILDAGRLTDGQGRIVDFKNTVIIMTSNIGSERILEFSGKTDSVAYDRMKEAVLTEMRHHFRPEFLNRVDEIVVFHSLTEADLRKILHIQLERLRSRLAERHIRVELTAEAETHLAREGYDPVYGARPLKRAIQKELETPIGRRLLAGEIRDGETVIVGWKDGGFTFTTKGAEQTETAAAGV